MNKNNVFFLLLLAWWLFYGCSHKIVERQFDGQSLARKGETVNICWEFDKADYVLVQGEKKQFAANDCFSFVANENTKLNITAINYFDTLSLVWDIIIKDRIKTGLFDNFSETSKSFTPSNYFSGIDDAGSNYANQIKVTSYQLDESNIIVNFIILDEYGYFISNYDVNNISITSENNLIEIESIEEVGNNDNDNTNIYFFIDNSYPAENIDYFFTGIANLFNQLPEYSIKVVVYNSQNTEEFVFPEDSIDEEISKEKGLNNLYYTFYHYLANIINSNNEEYLFVNLAFSGDNSSLFVDAKDVATLAKEKRCKIYNIISGDAANTHSFLYLSQYTGGRLYFTEKDDRDEVISAIREILLSQSYYYSAHFSYEISGNTKFILKASDNNLNCQDEFTVFAEPEEQYSDYQILALFDYRSTELLDSFCNNLDMLAEVAINNPGYTIELIGYAEIEGKETDTKNLAQYRAQIVADKLIELGVSPSQLRVVSEGSSKPIYYLSTKDWQKLYNRRVEIRWITPDDLPYEIIDNIYPSEEIAQNKVNIWKERGFKSYYERYLRNNMPYYKVKLWGYATAEEAEKVRKMLSKKYKGNFQVR